MSSPNNTATIDGVEVVCPICHAEAGIACSSPAFPSLIVRHHARFVAACEAERR